jgi:hypothetical protein
MERRTEVGLGVRARHGRDADRCATPTSRLTARARAQLAVFEFHLAVFERVFLQNFEL